MYQAAISNYDGGLTLFYVIKLSCNSVILVLKYGEYKVLLEVANTEK